MGARGETTLRVGETEYRLLYTNRAIAEAEAALGKSIIAVAREPGIADVGQLLAAGMEAARREAKTGGRAYTVNDAYHVMDEVGFATAAKAVLEAVAAVLSYSSAEESEPESPNP
jgi:hypothetical protein